MSDDDLTAAVREALDPTPASEADWPVSRRDTLRALAGVGALAVGPGGAQGAAGTGIADAAYFSNYGWAPDADGGVLTIDGAEFTFDGSDTIGLPDGGEASTIVLPDGATAGEVIGPGGGVLKESGIPDGVVAQYDATQESSTGSITSIADQIGSFDLSGNAEVISSGINGQQTYRFDGTDDDMSQSNTMASSDPFAVVYVAEQQSAFNQNAGYLDGGGDTEYLHYDNGNGDISYFRGGSGLDFSTKESGPHLFVMEAYGGDQLRAERDGTTLVDGATASSDLTGFVLADRGGGGENLEVDFGQVEVLENHTSQELEDTKTRLADKWGITLS